MKQGKADKNGRVRYLSETEEKRLRAALYARQEKQRIERQRYNQWRHERRMDSLPLMDGRYTDYLEPLVVLAMNTGLRRGELFNLEWADINLNSRLLTVQGGADLNSVRELLGHASLDMPHQPVRQWVLSFPFPLRFLLTSYPELMGKILGIVQRVLSTHLFNKAGFIRTTAQTGSVTLIQRFGSALNMNT
jgi:integrase